MKIYSTPAMTSMNVEVENVILAGSEPAYNPWGEGGIYYTYYPVEGGQGYAFAWDKTKKQWIDQAGKSAAAYGFDSSSWMGQIM